MSLTIPKYYTIPVEDHRKTQKVSTYKKGGKELFLNVMNTLIDVSEGNPIQLHICRKDECFDLMCIVFDKATKKPKIFLIDFKCNGEMGIVTKGQNRKLPTKKGKQNH